jgi:DNA-binding NarL/FixJ family response regulator
MSEVALQVAIVTNAEIVTTGLTGMFDTRPGAVEIVAVSGSPTPVDGRQPDVILYDVIGLHDGDGTDLDQLVKETDSAVVALARDLRPDLAARALAKGVDGCISLAADVDDLIEAIRSAAEGDGPGGDAASGSPDGDPGYAVLGAEVGLTVRETEILRLLTLGLSNQEIADQCFLSINSVKSYIRSAYRRIDATSRSQAVVWCLQHGFEPPVEESPCG